MKLVAYLNPVNMQDGSECSCTETCNELFKSSLIYVMSGHVNFDLKFCVFVHWSN